MDSSDSTDVVPEREERDFYPTRWSRLGSVGLSLGLGGFTAFAASVLLGRGELLGLAFAGIAIWSGWMGLQWFRRWRGGQPAIAVTDDGILDGSALGPPTFIPWSEIDSVSTPGSERATTITLRADARLRVPHHRRLLNWATRKTRNEYVLPTRLLDTHHLAIESFLSEWHESLLLEEVKEDRARLASASET